MLTLLVPTLRLFRFIRLLGSAERCPPHPSSPPPPGTAGRARSLAAALAPGLPGGPERGRGPAGDPLPATVGGHRVMVAGFAFGPVVFASLAATIGAFFFIDDRQERDHT